jgi:branched-chain amino acid transport system substrate-binding protein
VRARWPCPVALLAVALAILPVGLSGCGGVVAGATANLGNQLTVYSSLPLQGPTGAISRQIVNGEKLALAEAGGRVGQFKVSYYSLDDSNPTSGQWDPGVTAGDAKTAAQDASTIAYLGDYDSAASAVSLPLINSAGILQVSPASPYVGLTSSLDAGQDEPDRFYPTGHRTFGRLMAADPVQAAAQVQLMRALGVKRLYVLDDQDPFALPLAQILTGDAERAGIAVAGEDSLDTTMSTAFGDEARKIANSGAQAVIFSGGPASGAVSLWRQLHEVDRRLLLFGSSALIDPAFIARIGPAASQTYLTTPMLASRLYPPAAQRLFGDYRRRFAEAPEPYALYGYEAMSVVLAAIRSAGSHGNNRLAVIDRFFATKNRESVLGRYSIDANGDTTLSEYGVDRVVDGRAVFYRALNVR